MKMFQVFEPVSEVALFYVWCFNFPYIWPIFVRLISLVGITSENADLMIVNEYLQTSLSIVSNTCIMKELIW